MPTTLTNGVVVVNTTPHDLLFWDEDKASMTVAPSDVVLNAIPVTKTITWGVKYQLMHTKFTEHENGRKVLDELKCKYPGALIVGSIIAAQAYPGEVVSPVPYKRNRINKGQMMVKVNRFSVYPKEGIENG